MLATSCRCLILRAPHHGTGSSLVRACSKRRWPSSRRIPPGPGQLGKTCWSGRLRSSSRVHFRLVSRRLVVDFRKSVSGYFDPAARAESVYRRREYQRERLQQALGGWFREKSFPRLTVLLLLATSAAAAF